MFLMFRNDLLKIFSEYTKVNFWARTFATRKIVSLIGYSLIELILNTTQTRSLNQVTGLLCLWFGGISGAARATPFTLLIYWQTYRSVLQLFTEEHSHRTLFILCFGMHRRAHVKYLLNINNVYLFIYF